MIEPNQEPLDPLIEARVTEVVEEALADYLAMRSLTGSGDVEPAPTLPVVGGWTPGQERPKPIRIEPATIGPTTMGWEGVLVIASFAVMGAAWLAWIWSLR